MNGTLDTNEETQRKLMDLLLAARAALDPAESSPQADYPMDEAMVAAAVGGQTFRKEFFEAPKFEGPTPLTVTEDGRVFGHVALFDACYLAPGGDRSCITPPRNSDFSRFEVHGAKMDDGSIMRVGVISFGEGHFTAGSLRASQKQYADMATAAAKVTTGEDQWGIWVSGEVLDQFRDRAYDLLLSPLSGHWEPDLDNRGKLTMIAAHVVVTPGFAVPRLVASYDADGELDAVMFSAPAPETFLDIAPDLFDQAVEQGAIVKVGVREEDGVVLYARQSEAVVAAALDAEEASEVPAAILKFKQLSLRKFFG